MKKIIVPVDFSAPSRNAALYAARMASFYNAEIMLYHCYEMPVALGEFAYPVFDVNEMQAAAEHELNIILEYTNSQLTAPINIQSKADMGMLEDNLEALCDVEKPDMVVMGLTGKNALTRLVIGSNTLNAIAKLTTPLLIVPSGATFNPIQQIGFACDFKVANLDHQLKYIKALVRSLNAGLQVLNVDHQDSRFEPNMVQDHFYIHQMFQDIAPSYHNIDSEDVTQGINHFAAEQRLDWVVMIPKKHPILQKVFGRSHTQHFLYHSSLPVLCVHG